MIIQFLIEFLCNFVDKRKGIGLKQDWKKLKTYRRFWKKNVLGWLLPLAELLLLLFIPVLVLVQRRLYLITEERTAYGPGCNRERILGKVISKRYTKQ